MNALHTAPRALSLLTMATWLAACPGAESQTPRPDPILEITSPAEGDLVTTTRVTVRGTAEHADAVLVDGEEVSVVGGSWDRMVTVSEGEATVTVEARGVSESVTFTVDVSPPALTIEAPARGAFLPSEAGATVEVVGTVSENVSGLSLVKVDEQIVQPDGEGRFRFDRPLVEGLNEITVTAIDNAGNTSEHILGVLHGPLVDPTEPIDPGFDITLDAAAFPKIAAVVEALLTPALVRDLIDENLSIEDVTIRDVSFAPLEITATPRSNTTDPSGPGHIDFEVVAREVNLAGDFTFSGNDIALDVTISEATIRTALTVSADGEGSLDLMFGESELDLAPGAITWEVEAGGSELSNEDSDLLADIVEDIARFAFSELLSDQIFEQLYDPALLNRQIELLGRTLSFELRIEEVITNASGVFARATVAMPDDRFAGVPEVPGALALSLGTPQTPSLEADAIATTNHTAINRLLHGAWRSGLLNQTLAGDDFAGFELPIELEAGALALVLDGRVTNHADNDSPAGLALRPQLPPVISLDADAEGTGLRLRLGELHVDLLLDVDSQPKTLVTLAMFLDLGVSIAIEDANPSFTFDVSGRADVIDEPLFDLDDADTEELLDSVFALVPGLISEALVIGGEADVTWLKITNPQVLIHGLEGDQVSVGLDLEPNAAGLEE